VGRASNASLAESSIDIFIWNFPLKSHFADAAGGFSQATAAQLQARACATRHPAVDQEFRSPSRSWTYQRRGIATPLRDVCACPALPSGTPGLGHLNGIGVLNHGFPRRRSGMTFSLLLLGICRRAFRTASAKVVGVNGFMISGSPPPSNSNLSA
jgi:hypothetical protein